MEMQSRGVLRSSSSVVTAVAAVSAVAVAVFPAELLPVLPLSFLELSVVSTVSGVPPSVPLVVLPSISLGVVLSMHTLELFVVLAVLGAVPHAESPSVPSSVPSSVPAAILASLTLLRLLVPPASALVGLPASSVPLEVSLSSPYVPVGHQVEVNLVSL